MPASSRGSLRTASGLGRISLEGKDIRDHIADLVKALGEEKAKP